MEYTKPITELEARKKTVSAVKGIYDVAKLTIGPEGKNAILARTFNRGPRVTNDGVTIIENIKFKDSYKALVGDFFKEASKKTNELAGDGTTGTAVIAGKLTLDVMDTLITTDAPLASAIVDEELENTSKKPKKKGVRALRKELNDSAKEVIEQIKSSTTKINSLEELEKIAVVSIGKEDEDAAKKVAQLVWEIGRDENGNFVDNHIDVVEGYKGELEVEKIVGMRFPAKVPNKLFVTNPDKFEMVLNDYNILITNYTLDSVDQIIDLMNKTKVSKLAIFAPAFSAGVLKTFLANREGGFLWFPVHCPALRTEQLEDLAVYTNSKVINKEQGMILESITKQDFGFATKIVVKDTENREDAILIGGKGERVISIDTKENPIQERIKVLKGQMLESRNEITKISLQKRIANLSSAIGIIRVGSATSGNSLFLKLKIEDGVFACKSALEEGYVKGGGLCLKEISDSLEEGNYLKNALKDPYEQIQKNAGGNLEISEDIIDSAKTVRLQVKHAVEIASVLITVDINIPEEREKNPVEGYESIAKAIAKWAYLDAKHKGQIKESEDERERDREEAFAKVLLEDKD